MFYLLINCFQQTFIFTFTLLPVRVLGVLTLMTCFYIFMRIVSLVPCSETSRKHLLRRAGQLGVYIWAPAPGA